MHFPKPDTFVLTVAAMSEKMVEQANRIFDLENHLASHHETMDADQRTITDLREQLEEVWNLREQVETQRRTISDLRYRADNYDNMRRENDRLYAEVQNLRTEKIKRDLNISPLATPEEAGNTYMLLHGVKVWYTPSTPEVAGGKIECIKVVRSLTGWGLKETKDFVEAYMARHENQKEETPSGTKRSSQIPAGVGEGVKKSA